MSVRRRIRRCGRGRPPRGCRVRPCRVMVVGLRRIRRRGRDGSTTRPCGERPGGHSSRRYAGALERTTGATYVCRRLPAPQAPRAGRQDRRGGHRRVRSLRSADPPARALGPRPRRPRRQPLHRRRAPEMQSSDRYAPRPLGAGRCPAGAHLVALLGLRPAAPRPQVPCVPRGSLKRPIGNSATAPGRFPCQRNDRHAARHRAGGPQPALSDQGPTAVWGFARALFSCTRGELGTLVPACPRVERFVGYRPVCLIGALGRVAGRGERLRAAQATAPGRNVADSVCLAGEQLNAGSWEADSHADSDHVRHGAGVRRR